MEEDRNQLLDTIKNLGTLSNRASEVVEKVKNLKTEQRGLYDAVQNVLPLLNRQQGARRHLEELLKQAKDNLLTQNTFVEAIIKILNELPTSEKVTSTMREINDAISELNNANDKYNPQIDENYINQGGGKRGGYKVLRDTVARTEVRSRTPSSLNRRNITKTKRTKIRRQKTRTPIKKQTRRIN
jgi:chromosome segregation ATPase